MNTVESRPLRYFVAVAEELNFTRAAARLGIAAPALSRAISGLESNLGLRLLERSTRTVALTDAGAALLADARAALLALDAATRRARRAAGARETPLVLAVKADVEGGLLEGVLKAYRAEHAGVPVEVLFTGWQEQPGVLRAGEADVAIAVEPFDSEGLDTERLLTEPQVLALPTGHPLAGRPRLLLADLEEEHQLVGPGSHVYVPHGAQRPVFGDMLQMLRQIELGRMLALFLARRTQRPSAANLAACRGRARGGVRGCVAAELDLARGRCVRAHCRRYLSQSQRRTNGRGQIVPHELIAERALHRALPPFACRSRSRSTPAPTVQAPSAAPSRNMAVAVVEPWLERPGSVPLAGLLAPLATRLRCSNFVSVPGR